MSLTAKKKKPTDFYASLAASEHPDFLQIVSHVYEAYYGPRGLVVSSIVPCPKELQAHVVDFTVTLESPHNGETIESLCELKTEAHPARNISVERWSGVEKGIEGWPFKPIEIHQQRLLTVWNDGTCFFPYLDDYKCYLTRGPLRAYDEAKRDGKPSPYKTYTLTSEKRGTTWTTEGFLVPVDELRREFGRQPFYELEGEWLELASEAIRRIKVANSGGDK